MDTQRRRVLPAIHAMWLLLLLFVSCLTQTTLSLDYGQKVSYHLSGLNQNVEQIKTSLKMSGESSLSRTRRSSTRDADEIILHSVASYCGNFLKDPDVGRYIQGSINRQSLMQRDISGYKVFEGETDSGLESLGLNVFPYKVWAEMEGDKLWLIFHVVHSEEARISKLDPFDFQEVVLKLRDGVCKKIVSLARFEVDTTKCDTDKYKGTKIPFKFTSEKNKRFSEVFYIDVCKMVFYLENRSWQGRTVSSDPYIIEDSLDLPTFGIGIDSSGNGNDSIRVVDDNNGNIVSVPSYDFRLVMSSGRDVLISLLIWNWDLGQSVTQKVYIRPTQNRDDTVKYEIKYSSGDVILGDEPGKYFAIETLECHDESVTPGSDEECLHIRLALNATAIDHCSARLSVKVMKTDPGPYVIAKRTSMAYTFDAKVPNVPTVFPADDITFDARRRFFCDKDGEVQPDVMDQDYGKKCVARCHASGSDIAAIYIAKIPTHGNADVNVRTGSYILADGATAVWENGGKDLDLAEGEYQCTAVDVRGRTKKHTLNVYTTLLTKVRDFFLNGDDKMETASIECQVFGDDDTMNISVTASDSTGREKSLDAKGVYLKRNMVRNNTTNETTLYLDVPWSHLKYPLDEVKCQAEGERGKDSLRIDLGHYFENKFGIFPNLNRSEFQIKRMNRTNFFLSCAASGVKPMNLTMSIRLGSYRNPEVVIGATNSTVIANDGGQANETKTTTSDDDYDDDQLVLKVNFAYRKYGFDFYDLYSAHVTCVATNVYGKGSQEYRDVFYHIL